MSEASPWRETPEGLRVVLRVQPGASRTAVEGVAALPDGRAALKVRVGAAPEGGKANAAVLKLLAKCWQLPRGALTITAGHGQRLKTLAVAGEPADLRTRLQSWLDGLDDSPAGR